MGGARFPTPLPEDGVLRLLSVAGRVKTSAWQRGIDALAPHVKLINPGAPVSTGHNYLSASTQTRIDDLESALNESVDGYLCVRGGYGSMHLLPALRNALPSWPNRPFAGYSDITAMHLMLNRAGFVTYHSPVLTALTPADGPEPVRDRLLTVLRGQMPREERVRGLGQAADGATAEGPLVGGNLSLLAACSHIPGCELPKGAIVLIEDVGEWPYRIDRMLTGLLLSGAFDDVAGFAIGNFHNCGDGLEATNAALQCLAPLGVPVVHALPIGHRSSDLTVPLGAPVQLDSRRGELLLQWQP